MKEMKWVFIFLIIVSTAPFVALALSEWGNSQCRTEAIKAQRSTDEIVRICK